MVMILILTIPFSVIIFITTTNVSTAIITLMVTIDITISVQVLAEGPHRDMVLEQEFVDISAEADGGEQPLL